MLEALIAIGVSAMYIMGILGLTMAANQTSDRATETARAVWNMNEGLEALQTMSFADLTNGNIGSLTLTNGKWILGAAAPQTLPDGMTRTLKVQPVSRDASCNIVASGGTVDTDSKTLVSEIAWSDSSNRNHIITSSTLRTNWEAPTGTCFSASMVNQITFNISGAVFSGGKQLRQVYFTNNGSSLVIIDKISMTWDNGTEFSQLFMDTSKVWSETGPGTPTHDIHSGEEMNIQNFTLPAGSTAELNKGQFDDNMTGATLTMTVTFTDGSVWTSPPFNPL